VTEWPLSPRNRKGRPQLTSQQQELADELTLRALAIRAASRGAVSIREAVDLAAVELQLELPQTPTESEED
jgi:hypothetical protein